MLITITGSTLLFYEEVEEELEEEEKENEEDDIAGKIVVVVIMVYVLVSVVINFCEVSREPLTKRNEITLGWALSLVFGLELKIGEATLIAGLFEIKVLII